MKINQKYTGSEQIQKKEPQDRKEEDDISLKEKINKENKEKEDKKEEDDISTIQEKYERAKVDFEQTAFFDRLVLRLEAKKEKENLEQANTVEQSHRSQRNSIILPILPNTTSRKEKEDVPGSLQMGQIGAFIKGINETTNISNRRRTEDEVKENKNINEANEKDKIEETEETRAKFVEVGDPIEKYSTPIQNLEKFLDSMGVIVLMVFVTVFVLVGDDIKTLALTYIADQGFDYTKAVCFGLFILEIILTCISKKGYSFSFFFYVDVISTLSLIQDIDFIILPLIGLSDS